MLIRLCPSALIVLLLLPGAVAQQLTKTNYDRLVPAGKEVDAIYGDYALGNEAARAVIARPVITRNANMTVRSVGGALIDFAVRQHESDQLSAFYPGRRKTRFTDVTAKNGRVIVSAEGTDSELSCSVRYSFLDNLPVIQVATTWKNTSAKKMTLPLEDDIRADGGNEDMIKSSNGRHELFFIHDIHWQQAYAVIAPGFTIRSNSNSRESVLSYELDGVAQRSLEPGEEFTLKRSIIVGRDLPDVRATIDDLGDIDVEDAVILTVQDANGEPISDARVQLLSEDGERGTCVTDEDGRVDVRLPTGVYSVNVSVAGITVRKSSDTKIEVNAEQNQGFILRCVDYRESTIQVTVTDETGQPIPAKVEFRGTNGTPTPDWGPDSGEFFVRNLAYTANGTIERRMATGTYDVIVSRGPEYDAVFTKLDLGKQNQLNVKLNHSVKTPGWVSSDFHSHSSPSGDNTGSQLGRILNLAAANIEFAPCTEHNRVSTYEQHISGLKLSKFIGTVTGMELTGTPLPLNHQNVFPMIHRPRTQDGGGPVTDVSPESQIERLHLWDDRSQKLIQQNHPDIGWLFYDKTGDGKPDGGYARSFEHIDVMEIHPIDRMLARKQFDVRSGKPAGNNRMFNWLQLLNQGFRVYGVVNTDAHYNFHGSGPLRNWIRSETDDPSKIDPMDIVRASEAGQVLMSNGPFLEATFNSDSAKAATYGDDIQAKNGHVTIDVKVQCPDWLDVDTVFVLVNGVKSPQLSFTRDEHADAFGDGTVKFEKQLSATLKEDAHLIVVTGHRTEIIGDVEGPSWGRSHPAAVTNPVFVDVDGNGFKSNQDTLGYPLPVKFKAP